MDVDCRGRAENMMAGVFCAAERFSAGFITCITGITSICKMPVGKVLRRSLSPNLIASVRAYRNNHSHRLCSATSLPGTLRGSNNHLGFLDWILGFLDPWILGFMAHPGEKPKKTKKPKKLTSSLALYSTLPNVL